MFSSPQAEEVRARKARASQRLEVALEGAYRHSCAAIR